MAKTVPPEFPKPKVSTSKSEADKTEAATLDESNPLDYCQRVLAEHDGLESNIPVGHDYWRIKRSI